MLINNISCVPCFSTLSFASPQTPLRLGTGSRIPPTRPPPRILARSAPPQTSACPPTATVAVAPPHPIPTHLARLPPSEQALLLISFLMCTIVATTVGFFAISLPTFYAARRVLVSLDKLSKIVRAELPGTIAAIRLSGIEISDLTLQLNRLRTSLQELNYRGQSKSKHSEVGKSKSSPIIN